MAALSTRRWHKFREMLWLSHRWKTRDIQSVCRGFSTGTKETAKRFSWTLLGSLAFGVTLGYHLPKFNEHVVKWNFNVGAKTIPSNENNSSDSGSPPRSATFNFIADAVEIAAPAVVYIEVTGLHAGRFGFMDHVGPTSSGSGFIVTEDVKLKDGREFSGTVVDIDLENDLAVVKLDTRKNLKFPTLTLGSSSSIRPGEWVVAMGSPLQLSNTITAGIVGNSGGPLVNLDGHVIGINAITVRFAAGISFSIPIDTAKDFLSQAIERVKSGNYTGSSRSPRKPLAPHQRWYIGVSMLTLTPQILEELRWRDQSFNKVESGVLVPQVNYGSPAHKAGLQPGDIITKMNGNNIASNKEVYQHVLKGETLHVEVKRGRQYLKFTIHPEIVG
ncbi:Serine protease htra2, mitochondrial [Desmophyllum pertusum]|uniref:Serine protease htra2, mitochondrial n=1 Tax=Desmophyllum pertusum TaxID=174260 RepID=A0A9X0A3J6_9CNID|nr:Serine protease htra2, mitochondrial [Desmophyllum pertusum]